MIMSVDKTKLKDMLHNIIKSTFHALRELYIVNGTINLVSFAINMFHKALNLNRTNVFEN